MALTLIPVNIGAGFPSDKKIMRVWLTVWLLLCLAACGDGGSDPTSPSPIDSEPAAMPVDSKDAPAGALSGVAQPKSYQLKLDIDPREDSFGGQAVIVIDLRTAADGIWLHGQSLRVESLSLTTADGRQTQASYQEVLPSGVARVDFGREVTPGEITLTFDYSADFDQNLAGLFKVEEQGDAYALAKSESIQARKYLPGFDQPAFKAPFDISLTIPKGYQAIGNAPEISRTSIDAEYDQVQFATTPPMPTYLLSLAVGPFDVLEVSDIPPGEFRDRSIPLRGVARRGKAAELEYVLSITPRYVEIFEQALGRPYPFQKLDIVAAPAWPSGATELSGAISYREERLFLPDNPSPGARLGLLGIHAHEIAHMWFGNEVTPPWWDDLWLKEGFATWATPMVLSIFEPDGQHDLNGLARNFGVMSDDSLATARAIREPIGRNEDIRNAYDGITYSKGQAVIHMVDSYFGAERFRRALGGYLQSYADGVADSVDFYQTIGEQTSEPELTRVFRDFVEQPGVPVLDVALNCADQQPVGASFSQTRYRPLGSEIDPDTSWSIPVCVRYAQGEDSAEQCAIITRDNPVISLDSESCPDWLMPNANGSGYYRWRLGDEQWQALLNQFDELLPGEQMALVDSVTAAFESGNLDQTLLLQTVELAAQSGIRHVVTAPLPALERYLNTVFEPAQATALKRRITPWYIAALMRVDNPANEAEGLLKNRLQEFLAQTLRHTPVRYDLTSRAYRFTAFGQLRDAQAMDADMYETALTVAVQEAGPDFYAHLINTADQLDDPRYAAALPVALGAITDPEFLSQARAYLMDEQTGPRETFDMLTSMLKTPALREQHWEWYQANLPAILDKIPEQWRRRTPRVAADFCSSEKIGELEALFELYGDQAPGYELALKQTRETIGLCQALRGHIASDF